VETWGIIPPIMATKARSSTCSSASISTEREMRQTSTRGLRSGAPSSRSRGVGGSDEGNGEEPDEGAQIAGGEQSSSVEQESADGVML
jgi:hypothetical protein